MNNVQKIAKDIYKIVVEAQIQPKQIKDSLFSYGAFSPDGDTRYSDHIKAVLEDDTIIVTHTMGGAAGGMDSYTPRFENENIVAKFKLPEQANHIISWIKASLKKYTFLKYVKLNKIVWTKANGQKVNGLSQDILDDVLSSYNFETPKVVPFQKWIELNKKILEKKYEQYKKNMKKYKYIKALDYKRWTEQVYRNTNKGKNEIDTTL